MTILKKIDSDPILKVGNVNAVKGRNVEVLIDKRKNSSNLLFEGQILKNVSVGSYIKICKGFEILIGKIDGEYISEDINAKSKTYSNHADKIKRILNVSLLGYFDGISFKQGIKELPLIDNECFLLTQEEFESVHKFIKIINGIPDIPLKIGVLASEKGQSIEIGINSIFSSHIGIFGNTGSGKSYTMAGLYHKLFRLYENKNGFKNNAKFLFIDFNGEYASGQCLTKAKTVFNLSTRKKLEHISENDKIPINEKMLIDPELLSILANATDKTQKPFIDRVVKLFRLVHNSSTPEDFMRNMLKKRVKLILSMANKEKAYALVDYMSLVFDPNFDSTSNSLTYDLDWQNTNQHFYLSGVTPTHRITDDELVQTKIHNCAAAFVFSSNIFLKLVQFMYLQLVLDIYNDKALYEHIGPAINKLRSKSTDLEKVLKFDSKGLGVFSKNNIAIINLNDTNIDVKKTIPLILAKHVYNVQKREVIENNGKYLNIIIDEAHNILSHSSERESSTWKDYRLETFEEIIKEGRKFGVFLTIASQRPSDISDTIISQLHNYFLHRLINNRDIQAVERTISYLDKVSFEALPIMPTGTCVLAGLCAHVPIIVEIDPIEKGFEPNNQTIKPTDFWE